MSSKYKSLVLICKRVPLIREGERSLVKNFHPNHKPPQLRCKVQVVQHLAAPETRGSKTNISTFSGVCFGAFLYLQTSLNDFSRGLQKVCWSFKPQR